MGEISILGRIIPLTLQRSWIGEILSLKKKKIFKSIDEPINVLLAVVKTMSDCCKLPFKPQKKTKDADAAMAGVLSELDDIFAVKMEQRTVLKAFVWRKDVFSLFPAGFGKSFNSGAHCGSSQGGDEHLALRLTLTLPRAAANRLNWHSINLIGQLWMWPTEGWSNYFPRNWMAPSLRTFLNGREKCIQTVLGNIPSGQNSFYAPFKLWIFDGNGGRQWLINLSGSFWVFALTPAASFKITSH